MILIVGIKRKRRMQTVLTVYILEKRGFESGLQRSEMVSLREGTTKQSHKPDEIASNVAHSRNDRFYVFS